jgi:hypothetical protein
MELVSLLVRYMLPLPDLSGHELSTSLVEGEIWRRDKVP